MTSITYKNPVWPEYFADPFVLKTRHGYFAYGTARANEQGRQFPVLRSDDLVHWKYIGHALAPLRGTEAFNYWAPEVAEKDGKFFLYYSAAPNQHDEQHRLRVAIADDPMGPFTDSGNVLMPAAGFSIDAHPFRDPRSGDWFLYFAADFTDDEPHGTGLAASRLSADMMHVAGEPQIVMRASCPWQIYERNRNYKGRVWETWNCIEGPYVLFHDDKYWCFYSGGAWYSENYGLGFATADNPLGPWRDDFAKQGPTVLKGIPNRVVGPGHNSVVIGPDDKTQFIVYHAWDVSRSARRMCIDPLRWTKDGPRCDGPSVDPKTIDI